MNKLLLNLILHRSKPKQDQGFSLFEVTIAILVSSAFLMGTLQAMTINAVVQVKSERKAKALFWIQEDIEKLQAAGSAMDLNYIENSDTLNPANPTKKTRTGICNPFAWTENQKMDRRLGSYLAKELDSLLINDGYDASESRPALTANTFSGAQDFEQFETDENGKVIFTNQESVLRPVKEKVEQEDGTKVDVTKKVIVQVVRDGRDESSESDIENNLLKDYSLVRMLTVSSQFNYHILQVYYRVGEPYDQFETDPDIRGKDEDGDTLRDDESGRKSIIAENYTEVIPAAAADCGFDF